MIGQLTNAGVAALEGSTLVNIPLAKLGDGYNYIPEITDTDIHGNEVFRTQPSAPMAATANIVRWSVYLDVNVGPFQFGELGLYLPNGNLFALFSAEELIDKINVGGANVGNEVNLLIFVSMVGDNYVIWLDLASTNNQLQVARANSPDQLPQPKDAYPNIYIMPGADDNQQSILAVTDRQGLWAFGGFDLANTLHGTVIGFDSNSITIAAADYNINMVPDYFGQLILQFTSGQLYGICRYVKTTNQSGANWRLSFNTPLAITPIVGDTFFIQKRNPLTLESGNLPVATRSTAGVVIPLTSLTLDSAGRIGVDWTKLSLNGAAATQNGVNGELTITISEVGRTGQYSDLLNIPNVFLPPLATDTQRGGMKIAPGTGFFIDANEVLQFDAGVLPDAIGLVAPTQISAGANLNNAAYRVPGLFWTNNSSGLVNKPPNLPDAPATLEVVPLSNGQAAGSVMQRWTQDSYTATRVSNGATFGSWVVYASTLVATKTRTGIVQIGDNITVDGDGVIDVPIATQSVLGVVRGGSQIAITPTGEMHITATPEDIGAQPQLPTGSVGMVPFIETGGTNELNLDYTTIFDNVATNAAELATLQVQPTQLEIFNSFYRFSHNTSGNFPALPSELNAWTYNTAQQAINNTTNSSSVIGMVTPFAIAQTSWELEVRLSSTSTDDDTIGIVIGFVKGDDGSEHTLCLQRTPGGNPITWALVYNKGQGASAGEEVVVNGTSTVKWGSGNLGATAAAANYIIQSHGWGNMSNPVTDPAGDGSIPDYPGMGDGSTRIRVVRDGNTLTCSTTDWDAPTTYLTGAAVLTADLSDDTKPYLAQFQDATQWGVMSFSQPNGRWEILTNTINSRGQIYRSDTSQTYDYDGSAWAVTGTEAAVLRYGVGRFVYSPVIHKLFYVSTTSVMTEIMTTGGGAAATGTFTLAAGATQTITPPSGVNPLDCILTLRIQDPGASANWYDASAVASVTYTAASIIVENVSSTTYNFRYSVRP